MVDRVDTLGLNRAVLPSSSLPAVVRTEELLDEEKQKIAIELSNRRSTHNKIEYEIEELLDKQLKLFDKKSIISHFYAANNGGIYTTKDIHKLLGIHIRTIQYHIRAMVAQGLLLEVERNRYKAVDNK